MSEGEAMQNAESRGLEFLGTVERSEYNTAIFQDRLSMVAKRIRYADNAALHEIHVGKERVHIYSQPNIYPSRPAEGLNFLPFHVSGAA